jgi:hypothetical protein
MSSNGRYSERWSTRSYAFNGALLGLFVGVVHSYVHAFWSPSSQGDLVLHIMTRMVTFILAGAAVFAAMSALRNWLMQRR